MFSVDNTKNEKRLRYPFFDYINIKWSTWVSYSFKTALDYNYFMIQWIFDVMALYYSTKNLPIEKLNLICNKMSVTT